MSSDEYGFASRILHRVALGSPVVLRATLQMEAKKWENTAFDAANIAPVFVCGLARSGSTLLLNAMVETGVFSTSTYRHMPFVLAPTLWSKKTESHRRIARDSTRAHDDGMEHNFDSEEAFEEVFWRALHGPQQGAVIPWNRKTTKAEVRKFRTFMTSVTKAGDAPRYVSKNNTNVTRIPALLHSADTARIVIPFRNPANFAGSTLAQHLAFIERDNIDAFAAKYMAWLGHHEFGPLFKPYGAPGVEAPTDLVDSEYLWGYWTNVYARLLEIDSPRVHFFDYDAFCNDPDKRFQSLLAKIGVKKRSVPLLDKVHAGRTYDVNGVSEQTRARGEAVYKRLVAKAG